MINNNEIEKKKKKKIVDKKEGANVLQLKAEIKKEKQTF